MPKSNPIPILFLALAFLLVGFCCLAGKLYLVQVKGHDYFNRKAKDIYTVTISDIGKRGQILDAKGSVLAGSLVFQDVYLDFRQIKESHSGACIVQALIDIFPSLRRRDIEEMLVDGPQRTPRSNGERLAISKISIDDMNRLSTHLAELTSKRPKPERVRPKGLRFQETYRRFYPKKSLLSCIIGHVDFFDHGIAGLEKYLDKYLQPYGVSTVYERSAKNNYITDPITVVGEKRDGYDIVLTIHEELQKIAEEEIDKARIEWQAESIQAVMVDPKTGGILAAAQSPAYDANDRSQLGHTPDYITQFQFEPGSMMKGLTMTLALDKGYVTLDRKFDCSDNSGLYRLTDTHRLGIISVREIVQKSSNIGTAKVALLMSPQEIYDGFKNFGLGASTGIGIPNEYAAVLKSPERWSGPSHSRIPIGYEASVTPLQMVHAYAAIANQGSLMQLRLIDSIRDPRDNSIVFTNPPREIRKVAGERAINDIVSALKLVTQEGGTATKAAVPGFYVAGKTGTSRKYDPNNGYSEDYFCSFIGFVPADRPAFVMLVTVNAPGNGKKPYYGGSVAGPIYERIAERALQYLLIKPDFIPEKKKTGR
jgi:cell division protein FtsI/penicillin-binding protein 2